ncbi:MAG: glycosyltransferase family 4 protein, partial [Methanobacterium sp.]|nr:glycosyltransferase family 4 protein [Methanobacterium sp.]
EGKISKPLGLVTYTIGKAGLSPLSDMKRILDEISDEVYLIITKDKEINDLKIDSFAEIEHEGGGNPLMRVLNIFITQIRISLAISRLKNVDTLFFFMGGETLILPMLMSKLLNKKVYLALAASQENMSNINKDFFRFFNFLCRLNFYFADKIIVYSKNLVKEWDLARYEDKISIASQHIIDDKKFYKSKEINQRDNIIGYVGRLSPEKGVLNLVKAIPSIIDEREDLKFMVIGEGKLRPEIEKYIEDNQLDESLQLKGWVSHDKLGEYLNDFKVLILPSYTEGLPGVILEAMACGTPVLSTAVGSVPDIIEDQTNGFLLEDNSISNIEKGVIKVLDYPELNRISQNGLETTKSYTLQEVVVKYKNILQ